MLRFLRKGSAELPPKQPLFADPKPNPSSKKGPVSIQLNIPAYGGVFMTSHQSLTSDSTDPASTSQQAQFVDRELSGEIEIAIRRGNGPVRCKAIRATVRSLCRLYMGEQRGWEEDVLFERSVEMTGAMILEEGLQRLSFTILVPFSLPTWDTHPEGIVRSYLIGTVDGLGADYRASVRPTSGLDQGNYADGIPAPFPQQIQTQMTVSWPEAVGSTTRPRLSPANSVDSSRTSIEEPIPWLHGSVMADRCVSFLYNPHPSNGVNRLDERRIADVPGLGALDVRFLSQVWSVGALLFTSISFPATSPAVVVYYARVLLAQITTFSSPRDPAGTPPRVTRREFTLWEEGSKPSPNRTGAQDHTALWRGVEAGGSDADPITLSGTGRLPNDETMRCSTLEGIESPIHVKHELVAEVFHSVYNEDLAGKPLRKAGHGVLRRLSVDKPVIVPSCAFIPQVLELPSYEWHKFATEPCGTCATPPESQACRTCPLSSVPHARHDLDIEVFSCRGTCEECERRFISDSDVGWKICACGLTLGDMKERLKLEEEWQRSRGESGCGGRSVKVGWGDGNGNGHANGNGNGERTGP